MTFGAGDTALQAVADGDRTLKMTLTLSENAMRHLKEGAMLRLAVMGLLVGLRQSHRR